MIECKHIETTEKKIESFKPDDESDMMKVTKNITGKQKKKNWELRWENRTNDLPMCTFNALPFRYERFVNTSGAIKLIQVRSSLLVRYKLLQGRKLFFFFYVLKKNAPGNESVIFHLQNFFLMEKYLTLIGALTYCATVKLPPVHPERTDSR